MLYYFLNFLKSVFCWFVFVSLVRVAPLRRWFSSSDFFQVFLFNFDFLPFACDMHNFNYFWHLFCLAFIVLWISWTYYLMFNINLKKTPHRCHLKYASVSLSSPLVFPPHVIYTFCSCPTGLGYLALVLFFPSFFSLLFSLVYTEIASIPEVLSSAMSSLPTCPSKALLTSVTVFSSISFQFFLSVAIFLLT